MKILINCTDTGSSNISLVVLDTTKLILQKISKQCILERNVLSEISFKLVN
jgi:hypothetical protein